MEHLIEPNLRNSRIQFPTKPTSCHRGIKCARLKTSRLSLTSCSLVVQSQLCTGPSPNLLPCLSSQWSAQFAANGPLLCFLFFFFLLYFSHPSIGVDSLMELLPAGPSVCWLCCFATLLTKLIKILKEWKQCCFWLFLLHKIINMQIRGCSTRHNRPQTFFHIIG